METKKDRFFRKAFRNPNFVCGFSLLCLLLCMTIISFFWTPLDPWAQDLSNMKAWPSALHWAGTDSLGRDVFSRIMVSGQTAFAIGLACVALAMTIGVTLALIAATFGRVADTVIMRLTDAFKSIPSLLFTMLMATVFRKGMATTIFAITLVLIPQFVRLTRASVLQVRESEYVQWATLIGASKRRIMFRHILPNVLPVVIVTASLAFSEAVLTEASLSYLGLGVQAPNPSWGSMLNEAQSLFMTRPYLALWPGLMITIAVLGFNVMGDGLAELLNAQTER